MELIKFSPPDITQEEADEVSKALLSGWITTGPRVKELERKIADFVGVPNGEKSPNCVCLSSQTACGEISLRLFGIGPQEGGSAEDEVITCAYTYTASASVVCHVGAKLVLIDSQKDSLEMDYDALEAAINEHTKAIIPIDIGGVPCDYDRIFEIVKRKQRLFKANKNNKLQVSLNRIAVLVDAAHALGASYHGKMVGSIGDFTNFSFHAVKNFTTGEGGAMTWNSFEGVENDWIYHQIQLYSLHGQSKDALNKNKPGQWEYDIIGPWYKCNMTDVMGAVGLIQYKRYPEMLKRRKTIIEKYNAAFKPLGVEVLPHYEGNHVSSGHLYITRIPGIDDQTRRDVIARMAELGVATNVHYKPLPMHTAYKNLGFNIKDCPNAYVRYINEITLPLHTKLTDEEVDYIIECYTKCIKEFTHTADLGE